MKTKEEFDFQEILDKLEEGFKSYSVTIIQCKHKKTKEIVPVLCITTNDDSNYIYFRPIATVFDYNPFDDLTPVASENSSAVILASQSQLDIKPAEKIDIRKLN